MPATLLLPEAEMTPFFAVAGNVDRAVDAPAGRARWPPAAEAQVRAAVAAVDDDSARQFAQRAFGPSE